MFDFKLLGKIYNPNESLVEDNFELLLETYFIEKDNKKVK